MRIVTIIAGILLGLAFLFASLAYFFPFMETPPPPPADSPAALFMGAFYPTGYLTFVKVLELLGGVLVAVPATRRLGLLILGPIIVNVLAFHIFVTKGEGLADPMIIGIVALALFLLWADRALWVGFIRGRAPQAPTA